MLSFSISNVLWYGFRRSDDSWLWCDGSIVHVHGILDSGREIVTLLHEMARLAASAVS